MSPMTPSVCRATSRYRLPLLLPEPGPQLSGLVTTSALALKISRLRWPFTWLKALMYSLTVRGEASCSSETKMMLR